MSKIKKEIKSAQNPLVLLTKKLHSAKHRKLENKFIAEGFRTVSTLLNSNFIDNLEFLFLNHKNLELLQDTLDKNLESNILNKIILVDNYLINKISTASTPSGILAVFNIKNNFNNYDINNLKINSGLVLDNLTDPGNVGTLLRTAAALDIKNIFIINGTDIFSPKVINSSTGNIANLNIYNITWDKLIKLKNINKLNLCALVPNSKTSIFDKNISLNNNLLIVSNEANGIDKVNLNLCENTLTLPMPGKTESLNAAIAGSIALYLLSNFKK